MRAGAKRAGGEEEKRGRAGKQEEGK